jgi:hypothetical protein
VRRLVLAATALLGCSTPTSSGLPQAPIGDASVFAECFTRCLRPSDCAVAFPDDNICPPGFRCARTFQCVGDGGAGD